MTWKATTVARYTTDFGRDETESRGVFPVYKKTGGEEKIMKIILKG